MLDIEICFYGDYKLNNFRECRAIWIGEDEKFIVLYYIYDTIIAFHTRKTDLVISGNILNIPTGKYLDLIKRNKKKIIPNKEFKKQLNKVLNSYTLKEVK